MPMGIEPTSATGQAAPAALQRRTALALLAGLGGLSTWALLPRTAQAAAASTRPNNATHTNSATLAAAWEAQGSFHIGLLSVAGLQLRVQAALEVPSRPHGVVALPDGSVLAVARRPGDWMVRWHPGRHTAPLWRWQTAEAAFPDRTFNGHVLAGPDGQTLYTTETDVETGVSLVGVRDARTLEKVAEWPTHGMDAHELIWDRHSTSSKTGAPTLIVANGGVPTAPETGRAKRDMHRMDSSLVRLDGTTGELLGQWRLDDPRLSLRHLAWNPAGTVLGIALQAEHDDPALRHAAPVHARFDGQALHAEPQVGHAAQTGASALAEASVPAVQAPTNLQGYGGSIVATPEGWAVSCPKAGCAVLFNAQGLRTGQIALAEVCALASDGARLWAGGLGQSLLHQRVPGAPVSTQALTHPGALHQARLDNHWGLVRAA
ncbi:DUF1513 domain-containing protein [Acidovorax sp. 56]|uniref:DUF1513 domain-containing protein n=1 Tax=Acidovorax sp. 56 TaxID=2035205 RepID=UPI001E4E1754|nr:DUF1513 domain-containing protein [Acidovorax sp. 56]